MSDAEIRAWGKANGWRVGDRGAIPQALRAAHETAQLENALAAGPDDTDFGDDPGFPGFPVSDAGDPPPDIPAERRPRAIATPRKARAAGIFGQRKKPAAKAKGKKPRVPVDDLIAGAWRALAGIATPLPATSRLLRLQAPVAGMVLEDAVKGTVVDTFLQPVARAGQGAEAVSVLIGPPLLCAAIEMRPDALPVLLPVLRELMLRWSSVAGPKMEAALKRETEFEEAYGQQVDTFLALLFQPDAAAEEDAIRRAQESMA